MSIWHDISSNDSFERDQKDSCPFAGTGDGSIGYHHFLGLNDKEAKGRVCEEEWTRTLKRIGTLSKSIGKRKLLRANAHQWENRAPSGSNKADDWPLPAGFPAGYTYLFQLAIHDLVQTNVPSPNPLGQVRPIHNFRRLALELETIFGGGPSVSAFAYEGPSKPRQARRYLKLGGTRPMSTQCNHLVRPVRDIPRSSFDSPKPSGPRRTLDVLIADPRNDDNLIISQMTALFHAFYNAVVERMEKPDISTILRKKKLLEDVGIYARAVTAHVYRKIIENDLLARILDEKVYDAYKSNSIDFLDEPPVHGSLPLEFSHAVGRIGHHIVRPNYKLNRVTGLPKTLKNIVRATTLRFSGDVPPRPEFLVDWSLFFPLDKEAPEGFNWGARFGLHIADYMLNKMAFPPFKMAFPPLEKERPGGLLYRDLFRGASAGFLSIGQIAQGLKSELNDQKDAGILIERGADFFDDDKRREITRRGLKLISAPSNLDSMIENPPLLFYVLCEAEFGVSNGSRLGFLGSVLIAEVFFRALSRAYPVVPQAAEDWATQIEEIAKEVFRGAEEVPDSMPSLISYTAAHYPDSVRIPK